MAETCSTFKPRGALGAKSKQLIRSKRCSDFPIPGCSADAREMAQKPGRPEGASCLSLMGRILEGKPSPTRFFSMREDMSRDDGPRGRKAALKRRKGSAEFAMMIPWRAAAIHTGLVWELPLSWLQWADRKRPSQISQMGVGGFS